MQTSTLCDLLEIKVEGPPLADFDAKQAVELWWRDCKTTKRVNQAPEKEYRPQVTSSSSSTCISEESSTTYSSSTCDEIETLNDWDDWFSQ